ncbi:TetR/AcrR family transcriptional regulator [Nocardia sp. CDC159]|uniref:TetR/AcrR family transcriptional regulator n=1 Tax=Nocardia pulmonis TaxID=2951408 RepID=A0A9X2IUQ8_9NOCA|nr:MULTISPECIES: TetR/AcrR family transcriptional regulator C-terminal ligand-binding domain-containing protein [Nocardia]MCM6773107.1 TetR/AcrR family transcriptional regulator [Nocardia pulmonis]MCM6785590.1 TetR/AcrR family transcriptional regulator [Nocardia sp. CDC159]
MTTSARTRPGGRSARIRAAVYRAATDLVVELGADRMTIPAVAARAGVTASTVYRRWGTLAALLADVAAHTRAPAPAQTGELQADLANCAAWTLAELSRPGGIAYLCAELAGDAGERRTGLRACLIRVGAQFESVLAAARARGEHPPPLDTVLDRVVAPLHFRTVFAVPGTDERYARGLATAVLDG